MSSSFHSIFPRKPRKEPSARKNGRRWVRFLVKEGGPIKFVGWFDWVPPRGLSMSMTPADEGGMYFDMPAAAARRLFGDRKGGAK